MADIDQGVHAKPRKHASAAVTGQRRARAGAAQGRRPPPAREVLSKLARGVF
jgi:hypothetical protein